MEVPVQHRTQKLSRGDKHCGGAEGHIRTKKWTKIVKPEKEMYGWPTFYWKRRGENRGSKSGEREESLALRLMRRHPIRQPFIP